MKPQLEKLRKNQKGGASVAIAVIMAMLIVGSLVQNIFVWDQYLRAEDRERYNEQINIEAIGFDIDGKMSIYVKNTGGVPTHLCAIWINDTRYLVDSYLNIEEDGELVQDLVLFPQPSANSTQIVAIITERGNLASKTYYPPSPENPPPWWKESAYPIIVIPENSTINQSNCTLSLSVWNRFEEDITVDLLVCTKIVVDAPASSKVEIITVDWTIPSGEYANIDKIIEYSVINGDGLRVELVSEHNWVVGAYIFVY